MFLVLNVYIGQCLPKTLMMTQLQSYEMFKVSIIFRSNKCVDGRGI